jgi:uncharacterized protein YlzI (FlbEa/FlbD family)
MSSAAAEKINHNEHIWNNRKKKNTGRTTHYQKSTITNQSGPGGVPKLDITGVEAYKNASGIRRPANTHDGTIVLINGNKLRTKSNGSEASQR